MKNRVTHFEIQADDVDRAKDFYNKTFGWKIGQIMVADNKGGMDYWGLTTGPKEDMGINGGMYKRPMDNKIYAYDCTIEVENIDKAIKDIKTNGGKIDVEKMEVMDVGWFARCRDTEGNTFGIMQSTNKNMNKNMKM